MPIGSFDLPTPMGGTVTGRYALPLRMVQHTRSRYGRVVPLHNSVRVPKSPEWSCGNGGTNVTGISTASYRMKNSAHLPRIASRAISASSHARCVVSIAPTSGGDDCIIAANTNTVPREAAAPASMSGRAFRSTDAPDASNASVAAVMTSSTSVSIGQNESSSQAATRGERTSCGGGARSAMSGRSLRSRIFSNNSRSSAERAIGPMTLTSASVVPPAG